MDGLFELVFMRWSWASGCPAAASRVGGMALA